MKQQKNVEEVLIKLAEALNTIALALSELNKRINKLEKKMETN